MGQSNKNSAVPVDDATRLVYNAVERWPKAMMLRELVASAMARTAHGGNSPGEIVIRGLTVGGVPKLSIWDTGPGQTAGALHAACDLSSTLRTSARLDANVDMVAKLASLSSNKHGLRFRSCHQGAVSELTLGQRDGIYGRVTRQLRSGESSTTVDVTARLRAERLYALTHDWTEVLLLGNDAAQDTLASPYADDPQVGPNWIAEYLCDRYFRLPLSLRLTLAMLRSSLSFRGYGERASVFDRSESVSANAGIVIHYHFAESPAALASDGLPGSTGMVGLVWRNEIYAARSGSDWRRESSHYGIPFAASHVSVFIELPQDFGVQPETYRRFLHYPHGDQQQVNAADFASLVSSLLPEWLRDLIAPFGPPPANDTAATASDAVASSHPESPVAEASPEPQINIYEAAKQAVATRDWQKAAFYCERLRETAPNQPIGYLHGGIALRQLGHLDAAQSLLADGASRFPENPWIAVAHATLAIKLGKLEEGLQQLETVRRRFPDHASGYVEAGVALRSAGRLDEAEAILAEAIERFPTNVWPGAHYSNVALQRRDFDEAHRRAVTVQEQFPDDPQGFIQGFLALKRAGHSARADEALREAIARFPQNEWLKGQSSAGSGQA